jgi:L-ascorbate metabolism protein UlaG (beta-lactamase superfamily)
MTVKLKWFPRSWVQIIHHDRIIYIDPSYLSSYFTRYPKRVKPSSPQADDGLPEALPKGDLILVTHSHKDHCKNATLEQLRKTSSIVLAPKSCRDEIKLGFQIVKPCEIHEFNRIWIETIMAYNTSEGSSTRKVHKKEACVGYLLTIDGIRIYHAGDTDFIPEMRNLGSVDIALLPIGGTFTMNIDDAVKAARQINPGILIPIHYLEANPHQLKAQLPEIDVRVLEIGEELIL